MRYYEILTEAEVEPYKLDVVDNTPDNVQKILNTYCKEAESSGFLSFPIWRGFKTLVDPVVLIDPSTGIRKAQNSSNHYNLLMDNSPYIPGWPKRTRSLIAASNMRVARSYGTVYKLIPFDGVKIAVCATEDIWFTGIDLKPELPFTGEIEILNSFLISKLGFPNKVKTFDEMIRYTGYPDIAKRLKLLNSPLKPEEVIPFIQSRMAPDEMGLRLMSVSEYASARPESREVWFSGPCLAIKHFELGK